MENLPIQPFAKLLKVEKCQCSDPECQRVWVTDIQRNLIQKAVLNKVYFGIDPFSSEDTN